MNTRKSRKAGEKSGAEEKGRGHGPDYLTPFRVQCGILQVSEGGTIFMPFSVKKKKQTNKRYREIWKLAALSERRANASGTRQWEPCRLLR